MIERNVTPGRVVPIEEHEALKADFEIARTLLLELRPPPPPTYDFRPVEAPRKPPPGWLCATLGTLAACWLIVFLVTLLRG